MVIIIRLPLDRAFWVGNTWKSSVQAKIRSVYYTYNTSILMPSWKLKGSFTEFHDSDGFNIKNHQQMKLSTIESSWIKRYNTTGLQGKSVSLVTQIGFLVLVAWPLERQDLPLMQGLKKKKRHGHRQCWLSRKLLFVFAGFFPWMKITYVFSNICSQREFFYTILSIRYDIRWFHIQCQSHVILHINHMHVQKWFTIEVRLHM